jgi:phage-related protein
MWKVVILNDVVEAEISNLPADMRAQLGQIIGLIEAKGFAELPRSFTRHLEDKLWELRVRGRDGISRAIYVTASGSRVVILRVFVKKTQQTPPKELRLARLRAKEIK